MKTKLSFALLPLGEGWDEDVTARPHPPSPWESVEFLCFPVQPKPHPTLSQKGEGDESILLRQVYYCASQKVIHIYLTDH